MYELVSIPKIQTLYRLNTNTILFLGQSHTCTFKQIHSVLSVLDTDMYLSNTNMPVWCLYLYVSFCTYIQDKSVAMLSVCAPRYIQIQTCRIPDASPTRACTLRRPARAPLLVWSATSWWHRPPAPTGDSRRGAEAGRVVDGQVVVLVTSIQERVDASRAAAVMTQLESEGYPTQQTDSCFRSDFGAQADMSN